MDFDPHHLAWLAAHHDRSEAWLRARLSDGFDVHHLDGDHSNDEPSNLVLIEHVDHLRLHGAPGNRLAAAKAFRPERKAKQPKADERDLVRWRELRAQRRARTWAAIDAMDQHA